MYRRIESLQLPVVMAESLVGLEDVIIDLNQKQMRIGQDADGADLYNYRSDAYAEFKQAGGSQAPFGVADFYSTGAFYRGMTVQITADSIVFDSTDPKTDKLSDLSNGRMFGLTDASKAEFKRLYLQDSFIDAARLRLRL